ncbi:MAG: PepSY-associated TM helix domain-containing protein [Angustibacter sp.]
MTARAQVLSASDVERSEPGPLPTPAPRPRRRVKRAIISVHRWTALVLGLLLVAITTSGVVLLYEAEVTRLVHDEDHLPHRERGVGDGITLAQAFDVARQHDQEFVPQSVIDAHGTYLASDDSNRTLTIDPATSQVIGELSAERTGVVDWTMGLLHNLHLCLLTCEDQPGYQAWLLTEVPGTAWASFEEGTDLAVGDLLLGVLGLLLGFLALSGIWLWWPATTRWAHGLRVRWRKGRFARDYDLHQVAGMIAVPFLLMWAITGSGFELGFVGKAWYQLLPGEERVSEFVSQEVREGIPDITPATAVAAAQREIGTTEQPTGFDLPIADDPTSTYTVWFADGFDPYGQSEYAGDLGVGVDRTTGASEITYGGPGRPVTQQAWEEWNFPVHTGYVVGSWWRLVWAVFGLVPLLLAITGMSTWLYRRRTRTRRRALDAAAGSPGTAAGSSSGTAAKSPSATIAGTA